MKVIKQLVEGNHPITELLPSYTKKEFQGIIFLISNLNNKFFTHKLNDDWMIISQTMKYSLFGQYNYRKKIKNNPMSIFNLLFEKMFNGSSISGLSDGYEPTKLMKDIYQKWIQNNHNTYFEVTEIDMKDVLISKGVEFIENTKSSTFSETVNIDSQYIQKHIIDTLSLDLTFSDLKEIVQLKELLGTLNDKDNLEIFYREVMSGRYYSVGKNHIQGLKRDIRKVVLHDYFEYDLNTSAPVLLCHIYKVITGRNAPSSIIDFINEKTSYREVFRMKYSINVDEAKTLFTALFFGASLIPNDYKFSSKLTKELGVEVINKVISDTYVSKLRKDINRVYKTVYSHYRDKHKGEFIIGYKDKPFIPKDEKVKGTKVVAHIYQSLESLILDSMVEFYQMKTKDFNFIRIHDCLYTKVEIDEVELEEYILEQTSVQVNIKDRNSTHTLEYFTRNLNIYDDVYQDWGPYMNEIIHLPEDKRA